MNPLTWLYYRYIFLRGDALERVVTALAGRPDVPTRGTWESEYQNGIWNRLYDMSEQAHNAVVLSYIAHLRPESSILEIGCGEGTLLGRLRQIGYRSYTGLDISEFVVQHCQKFADPKTAFIAADAESYAPPRVYDVIILNECVYYFQDPVGTIERYSKYLANDGIFVISIFDSIRTRPIRRRLKQALSAVDETAVSNSKGTWYCLVLQARAQRKSLAVPSREETFSAEAVSPVISNAK
jgi:SAM-dependent methyltransferase